MVLTAAAALAACPRRGGGSHLVRCEFLSVAHGRLSAPRQTDTTAALADFGLLDHRPHTSNGVGFLEMVSPCYKGQSFYIDQPSVTDHNLITAVSNGP